MAIDANTGTVLHNRSGDALRYPASLTKMMTLYMAFELIELGRLDYASKITMTEEGAAATPSKLGLKPGDEITVLNAIKALVTKSANDVAIALAQHIAGTEANFARLMTGKAHEIGMTKTVFKNASGLPDEEQVTTARDMLTLALRLQDEFPHEYKLFATRVFRYGGRIYRNHNALLGRYRGIDGIKTGYTRASGFNLVTSLRRDGKHVLAAVFGGKTSRRRNARMRALLGKALAKASRRVTRKRAIAVRAPPRPVRAKPPTRASAKIGGPEAPRPQPAARARPENSGPDADPSIAIAKVHPVLLDPALPKRAPAADSDPGLLHFAPGLPQSTLQAQAAALATKAAQGSAPQQADGPFAIQIGAYNDSSEAKERIAAARQRAGTLLDPYKAVAVPVQKGASQLYRARFRGFEARAATSTCLHLRRMQIDCFVVRTE